MFDEDEYQNDSVIELRYVSYDKNGNREADIVRRLHGEQTEYLPNVLNAFHLFLLGMTYTYVDQVVAVKSGGSEASSIEAE